MGLNCFWIHDKWTDENGMIINEKMPVPDENARKLADVGFSVGGYGSFRGKQYNEFILEVTDVTLYQERIENPTVRSMAGKLKEYQWTQEDKERLQNKDNNYRPKTKEEFKRLSKNFEFYSQKGAHLVSSW